MKRRIFRRINDGDVKGMKQDRYRHSSFEARQDESYQNQGVTRNNLNTLGGPYNENRGRRSADPRLVNEDNPFETGELSNWRSRQGWDRYFDATYDKEGNRPHGGALIGHDGGHRGKGPKGYGRSDDRIMEDVNETLYLSPDVDASDIEVSVKDGCVYFKGTVHDRRMKRMAELEVENISGVKDVQNLLRFDDTRAPSTQTEGQGNRRDKAGDQPRH